MNPPGTFTDPTVDFANDLITLINIFITRLIFFDLGICAKTRLRKITVNNSPSVISLILLFNHK